MQDLIIRGFRFTVVPIDDGGKQINIFEEEAERVTMVPFGPEAVDHMIRYMSMPNDELAAVHDEAEQKSREALAEAEQQGD